MQVSATSATWAHTVTGSDTLLIVGINRGQDLDDVTSVTYNGVAMTQLGKVDTGSSFMYLYGLVAAATGANNIVVNWTNSGTVYCAAASYTGVSQTGLPDSAHADSGNSGTLTGTTTVVAANCWLVGFQRNESGTPLTAGAGTVVRKAVTGNTYIAVIDSNTTVGTGSQSLITTSGSNQWGSVIASVAPVAAAVTSTPPSIVSDYIIYN